MHQLFEEFVLSHSPFQPIDLSEEELKEWDGFCSCHTGQELLDAHNDFMRYLNVGLRIAVRRSKEEVRLKEIVELEKKVINFHKTTMGSQEIERPVQNTLF